MPNKNKRGNASISLLLTILAIVAVFFGAKALVDNRNEQKREKVEVQQVDTLAITDSISHASDNVSITTVIIEALDARDAYKSLYNYKNVIRSLTDEEIVSCVKSLSDKGIRLKDITIHDIVLEYTSRPDYHNNTVGVDSLTKVIHAKYKTKKDIDYDVPKSLEDLELPSR